MIQGQLKGEMRFDWRPEGLACEITLPAQDRKAPFQQGGLVEHCPHRLTAGGKLNLTSHGHRHRGHLETLRVSRTLETILIPQEEAVQN
jgi:hypothetical protein